MTSDNRSTTPRGESFRAFIVQGWADRDAPLPRPRAQAPFAAARRLRLAQLHPGRTFVVPAGQPVTRSNDTNYRYRPHSAFAYLTGWGRDTVPGSVLVLTPSRSGHEATLYLHPTVARGSDEFYADPAIGEFWTGPRPSLTHVRADLGIPTAHLDELPPGLPETMSPQLLRDLSELRLVKDEFEIDELRAAVAATKQGFDDVIADLPRIISHPRGERLVEGAFERRARAEGNGVGYGTIAAAGPHASILHWSRNDGPVVPGDLILLDAGVERDSLYTADITRTLPVSGVFTRMQRRVYDAVLEAADAARAIVRPGIRFVDIHDEAMAVIAARTAEWGLLPVGARESLDPQNQYHRRFMIHGTGHHLGIDVHDCGQARRELYLDGAVQAGMVFTIEPGLYFQPNDLTVPAEFRGIGIRIEDDILVTSSGCENLSAGIPRTADEVEKWVSGASRPRSVISTASIP